jgi:N-acetylglucosaminyl-diphospho-decaprenol L-rhamnosyltransferase
MAVARPIACSIVVVAWECEAHLSRLVASMNRHLGADVELLVVDNNSSDRPDRAAAAWRGEHRFLRLESNRGYGAAANVGVDAARSDAVVTLNPDTKLLDGRIRDLAALSVRRDALAGPRLLNPDRSLQPSACGSVTGPWPWVRALVPSSLLPGAALRRTEPWRLDRTADVAWLCGACVAGPRERLLELGPFDPGIHLYGEDIDLGLRAAAAGIPSLFCPDVCSIVHVGQGSASLLPLEDLAEMIETGWQAAMRRSVGPARERRAWWARRVYAARLAAGERLIKGEVRWELRMPRAGRRPTT